MGDRAVPALETARMILRPFRAENWEDLRAIHGDPRAADTLSVDAKPFSVEQTQRTAAAHAGHWRAHGFGIWHAADRETGRFCGYAGVRLSLVEGRARVELAYAVVPAFWRQGRAGELVRAVVDHAFATLPFDRLDCFTLIRNAGSRKVMEGAGFRFTHEGLHAGLPHRFCVLTREMWEADRPG